MTIMQQMNLFKYQFEVAGFKLDYLEVWELGEPLTKSVPYEFAW